MRNVEVWRGPLSETVVKPIPVSMLFVKRGKLISFINLAIFAFDW